MAGVKRDAGADGSFHASLHAVRRVEPFEGMEHDRMMCDDKSAAFPLGLVEHGFGYVDRQQSAVHLRIRPPHDKPRIVVRLLQGERCEPLDYIGYLFYFHSNIVSNNGFHFRDRTPAAPRRSPPRVAEHSLPSSTPCPRRNKASAPGPSPGSKPGLPDIRSLTAAFGGTAQAGTVRRILRFGRSPQTGAKSVRRRPAQLPSRRPSQSTAAPAAFPPDCRNTVEGRRPFGSRTSRPALFPAARNDCSRPVRSYRCRPPIPVPCPTLPRDRPPLSPFPLCPPPKQLRARSRPVRPDFHPPTPRPDPAFTKKSQNNDCS